MSTTLPQIQNNGGNKMYKGLFTSGNHNMVTVKFKIITIFKITALEAMLLKIQYGAFVYIK